MVVVVAVVTSGSKMNACPQPIADRFDHGSFQSGSLKRHNS